MRKSRQSKASPQVMLAVCVTWNADSSSCSLVVMRTLPSLDARWSSAFSSRSPVSLATLASCRSCCFCSSACRAACQCYTTLHVVSYRVLLWAWPGEAANASDKGSVLAETCHQVLAGPCALQLIADGPDCATEGAIEMQWKRGFTIGLLPVRDPELMSLVRAPFTAPAPPGPPAAGVQLPICTVSPSAQANMLSSTAL